MCTGGIKFAERVLASFSCSLLSIFPTFATGPGKKELARYWRDAPQAVQEFVVPAIHNYYAGCEPVQRDEAMRSCGIAAMTLMLAAKEMATTPTPWTVSTLTLVGKLINLPKNHVITMFVAIGKGVKEPWPRGGQLSLTEAVIENRFA